MIRNTQILALLLFLGACLAKKRSEYILPPGLTAQEQENFVERFGKGERLYAVHCAQCHNYTEGRKQRIPDFNPLQLKAYTIRVQNKDHSGAMSEQQISETDLAYVVHFLMYKKSGKR